MGEGGFLISLLFFFVVRSFCLAGFPFFIGFYSKDSIIISISAELGVLLYLAFLGGCVSTVLYSLRLVKGIFYRGLKSVSFFSFCEDFRFFVLVSILFIKCWMIGGIFYWFFVSRSLLFLKILDLFLGLVLILFSFILFKVSFFVYFFVFIY